MAARPRVDPNCLFLDDDVDDDTFLRNSRNQPTNNGGNNPFDNNGYDQRQMFEQKKREIEERTLMSTERSLGLLRETEEVGNATAEELARQREQLEKTSKQLDEINTTLRFSQKHLNGLKSIFGGLKNYISGQKDYGARITQSSSVNKLEETATSPTNLASPDDKYNQHPTTRLRSDSTPNASKTTSASSSSQNNSFQQRIDNNLSEMSGNLSRLKHLAIDLHEEIVTSNDLIDDIHTKVDNVDIKIGRQNKEMNKILGKK